MARTYRKSKDNPSNWGGLSEAERKRREHAAWRRARHQEQPFEAHSMRAQRLLDSCTTTGGKTGYRMTQYGKVGFAKTR